MQHALGLMGEQQAMFAITLALGLGGLAALFMALFWPRRWRLPYRIEVGFVLLLIAIAVAGDILSSRTYDTYESVLPENAEASAAEFDESYRVLAFQWGYLFFDHDGKTSRNAVRVRPGSKVLFRLAANEVIHGFNIPTAGLTTELDPESIRSVWIRAPAKPGKYLIQCTNYCGLGHAQMKAWLVVTGTGPEHSNESGNTAG